MTEYGELKCVKNFSDFIQSTSFYKPFGLFTIPTSNTNGPLTPSIRWSICIFETVIRVRERAFSKARVYRDY